MKKLLTIVCATAAVAAPAFASSSTQQREAHKQAVKTCQAQHKALSKAEFKALYGKNGVAHCVKKETAENVAEAKTAKEQAQNNAAKQCKTEQADANFATAHDGKSFAQFYGSNGNGKNAYGKCVSQHARANEQELAAQDKQEDQNQVNAAKQCKAEKADANFAGSHDGKSFAEFYGTNHNNKNAFGKCVSKKAHEANQQDQQEQQQQS
jgi:hypothetical protein